jgi:hypothetical protein
MKLTITLMTGAGRSGVMAGALRVKLKPSPNRAHARALPLKRQVLAFAKSSKERLMRRSIGTAAAAFAIFIGSSMVSLAAETGGAPSAGEKGVAGSPSGEGIGSTSSTHNPNPPPSTPTGMENRSGSEMGSDTSTQSSWQKGLTASLFARAVRTVERNSCRPIRPGIAGFVSAK